MSKQRFGAECVSKAEDVYCAEVIKEIDADMKALGKAKIQAENAKLRPTLENMLKHKANLSSFLRVKTVLFSKVQPVSGFMLKSY